MPCWLNLSDVISVSCVCILKGLALFLVLDLTLAAIPAGFGKISLYNQLFPGRKRFPFGEDSSQSYNLSLFDLEAMFASHLLSSGIG
jgi:hypothetical protein